MARVPGTEAPRNQAGWRPGDPVRCRRSRSNGAAGVADRRGFLVEVRPTHVRVLLDREGRSLWLESEAVLAERDAGDPDLELLRRAFVLLEGCRVDVEDDELIVFSEGFPADAVGQVRALLGKRLMGFSIEAHGVHEVACRLAIASRG
ncbi:MAG: hypothetical protein H6825_05010 [Planctomycetes bacterium]|nr:hypothetical protein [Planctomycetota bacterium]